MGIIGKQIEDFLADNARAGRAPTKAGGFAQLVNETWPAANVTRQNIEHLLRGTVLPRNIEAIQGIAAVLGKTVDDLLAGRSASTGQVFAMPADRGPDLARALRVVAGAASQIPARRRKAAGQMLASLAEDPRQADDSIEIMLSIMAPEPPKSKRRRA